MCDLSPLTPCAATNARDEGPDLGAVARAFRHGVAWAVTCYGRDHTLDEGELALCYLCGSAAIAGERARVLGARAVCPPCQRACAP